MFITMILYLSIEQKTIRAMIDCDATFNFIFQMKIKKWDLQNIVDVSTELKTLNDIFFKCYEAHVLRTKMIDSSERKIRIKQTIIVANMTKIHMILSFLWLKKLNSNIDWFSVTMRWRIENARKFQKKTHVMIVAIDIKIIAKSSTKDDAQSKSSIENDTNLQDSNIAVINQLTFEIYCKRKDVQVYILDCKNLHDIEYTMHELIIEAMMKSSQKILEKYKDFANVFDKMKANELSTHDLQNHEINTKNKMLSFESIYNLFVIEFKIFRDYFDEFLIKEFIVSSFSSTKISILFAKKSKDDLRLCVNYKKLNAITIKNRYSMFLMNQLLNRFSDVKKFIKLNIQTAYNFIRIKKKDKWKTTFRCRYEQFEYRVMFFDFANAFATFQIHINFALKEYLNDFCVCYLDDILIYFQRKENHTNHVRLVLKRLKKHKMFVKLSKCVFDLEEIDYLKFIIEINDIRMNLAKIATIKKWVESTTRRHVRIFIKFAEFYRRFIKKFSKIVESLTNLLKERKKRKFDKMFKFIKKARKAFKKLKKVFIKTSILLHFDFKRRIRLKIDVFDFVISEIISQLIEKIDQWHFIAFFFRKMFAAKRNYEIEEKKMLAMIESCRVFRHYVKEALFSIQMLINHVNLNSFFKNKKLNRKEARWWKKFSDLNFHIEYRSNKLNLANDSSRRFDYESNESIIVNAIAKDDNKLIVNRVHVQVFIIEHDSQKNREKNDESSSTLSSMKKNRQFSSKSKTANEMNIENDFIRNEKSRSIVSHAYVNLIVRTKVLSTEKSVSAIQTKAFQAKFESRSFVIKKQHEKFKKTFHLVVKKIKDSVSKKAIEEIAHKDINFVNFSIELRIVLKILQQSDQFAQEKTISIDAVICDIEKKHDLSFLKYRSVEKFVNAVQFRKNILAKTISWNWHLRLKHCRSKMINQLKKIDEIEVT